jgi:serine/threonine protein kinase
LVRGESYYVYKSSDVWQMGMLIYLMLSGGVEPWQSADDISDPVFSEWVQWLRRKNLRVPDPFQIFTPRLLRLFKRLFEPKPKKRSDAKEVLKYLEDEWIQKLYRSSSFRRGVLERKASSSTNRSRSSGTGRSRTSSIKRKSFRNSTKSTSASLRRASPLNLSIKEGSAERGESCAKLSGSGRDKLSHIDKDFVKERVGQWILEAASSTTSNTLAVPVA